MTTAGSIFDAVSDVVIVVASAALPENVTALLVDMSSKLVVESRGVS